MEIVIPVVGSTRLVTVVQGMIWFKGAFVMNESFTKFLLIAGCTTVSISSHVLEFLNMIDGASVILVSI